MANIQVTYIFNAGRQGWSETWYVQRDSLSEAQLPVFDVGTARKGLLGKGATLEASRISDVDVFSDSLVDTTIGNTPASSTASLVRDNPSNAWLARVNSGTLYRRAMWLRGLPDAWVAFNSTTLLPILDPLLLSNFGLFATKVVQAGFRMRVLDKSGATPEKGITALALDIPTNRITVTVPGHGYNALDKVRIRKCSGTNAKQVNGLYTVFAPTTNTFDIFPPTGKVFLGPITYAGGGVVRKQNITYPLISSLELIRPAKRDTGRAFFVPRGRRRVVRS